MLPILGICVLITIVIVIICVTVMYMKKDKETLTNDEIGSIISAMDITQKNGGSAVAFFRVIGKGKVTPFEYAQMVTMYKRGTLTSANVRRLLART